MPQYPPVYLEFKIFYNQSAQIGAFKIWNFNKSMKDSMKCVREAEIYLNGQHKFRGIITKGSGSTTSDYSEIIVLKDGIDAASLREKIDIEVPAN